jgi:transglutaminase-like putative cysteine protease
MTFIDHSSVDLGAARRITYRVQQRFQYRYDSPVTALSQRLVVVPRRRHGDLHRRTHRVEVTGATVRRRTREDAAGNTVVRITAPRVEQGVEFTVTAVLERVRRDRPRLLPASALRDPRLLRPTRLTAPDDALRAMASDLRRRGGDPLDVCTAVHGALAYRFGVTTVLTTAAEALAGGEGVCQDSAHVMLAVCRLMGIPSRYVSGHLLGQGGTHAWVEVVVPYDGAATALAFDPCHGRRTDDHYVTVAVGRDYTDVAPTSGTYVGAPTGRLTGDRHVGIVALAA